MPHATPQTDIALISMPWSTVSSPSIQLGTLKALLDEHGFGVSVHSFYLRFMERMAAVSLDGAPLTLDDYALISTGIGNGMAAGEWVFRDAVDVPENADDHEYLGMLDRANADARIQAVLPLLRSLVDDFLDECVDEILAVAPRLVGFTTVFGQNLPSIALARHLKRAAPDLVVIFGGANCEGEMGAALHRAYDCIDIVVRGEAEPMLPGLLRELVSGAPLTECPGLIYRAKGEQRVIPEGPASTVMDQVPTPNYDEYFARLGRSPLAPQIREELVIPFETARGCWWGQKHHCTFCGLNGSGMTFRSKSIARARTEIRDLAERYAWLRLTAVDNIIDVGYLKQLLPQLRDDDLCLELFYETKSNLRREEVRALVDAGVRVVQPGIESLSTQVLKTMDKGVTGIQNLRLLKWAALYGLKLEWNILYAFPGEAPDEYRKMAELVPLITHLQPPSAVCSVSAVRFSPFFTRPEQLGIRNIRIASYYRHLYAMAERDLFDVAYSFLFDGDYGGNPHEYIKPVQAAVEKWKESRARLEYRVGPNFVRVEDRRRASRPLSFVLRGLHAMVLLACDDLTSIRAIATAADCEESQAEECLGELAQLGLVVREGRKALSLVVPWRREFSAERWLARAKSPELEEATEVCAPHAAHSRSVARSQLVQLRARPRPTAESMQQPESDSAANPES